VLDVLAAMPDESVDCIVTSPPYWALRAYSTPAQVWGGDTSCAHNFDERRVDREMRRGVNLAKSRVSTRGGAKKIAKVEWQRFVHGTCSSCGAWRGELGLEPTPELYVEHMVIVFREIRRVLHKRGTLWLNMGDSYVAARSGPIGLRSGLTGGQSSQVARRRALDEHRPLSRPNSRPSFPAVGLKSKDLVGMPWRVALALQEDGWWLRRDIVWSKPNPMPESVHDRPTSAHEYVFLLTRSAHYRYDAAAIAEPVSPNTHLRVSQNVAAQVGSARANGGVRADRPLKAVLGRWPSGWASGTGRMHDELEGRYAPKDVDGRSARLGRPVGWRKMAEHGSGIKNNDSFDLHLVELVQMRNARSVWTINTEPYPEAHFATFPEELPRRCILAGSPKDGVVMDPFAGSGTTLDVANSLGRRAVGIELSTEYVELIRERCDTVRMDEWNRGIPIRDDTVLEGPLWATATE
jgi:DNA modification methylase